MAGLTHGLTMCATALGVRHIITSIIVILLIALIVALVWVSGVHTNTIHLVEDLETILVKSGAASSLDVSAEGAIESFLFLLQYSMLLALLLSICTQGIDVLS